MDASSSAESGTLPQVASLEESVSKAMKAISDKLVDLDTDVRVSGPGAAFKRDLGASAVPISAYVADALRQEEGESPTDELLPLFKQHIRRFAEMDLEADDLERVLKAGVAELRERFAAPPEGKVASPCITAEGVVELFERVSRAPQKKRKRNLTDSVSFKRVLAALEGTDDDVAVEGADPLRDALEWRCPYSQAEVDRPMRNKLCQHTYNAESVEAILKGKAVCPARGCKSRVDRAQLEPDAELEFNYERAKAQRVKSKN